MKPLYSKRKDGKKGRLTEEKLQEEMKKGNGKKERRKEPAPSVTHSAAEARAIRGNGKEIGRVRKRSFLGRWPQESTEKLS